MMMMMMLIIILQNLNSYLAQRLAVIKQGYQLVVLQEFFCFIS